MSDAAVAGDAPGRARSPGSGYTGILRSTALIGGSTLVNVGIGVVRAKLVALWLGPAGVGLMGAYGAVADLSRSIAELGINSSGVRQIADGTASGDAARVARTATVLRRVALALALFGAVGLAVLARPVSVLTFGDASHATAMALLAIAVACRLIADAQGALIQGLRRIADLARAGIIAAAAGTLLGLPLIFIWRERGVVPALIALAAASLAASWWYSRKANVSSIRLAPGDLRHETAALLRLGLAFLASAMLVSGAAYAARVLVLRSLGLESTGYYQAAWTLGGLYVGFVLQAMGADFYPRLVGVASDHPECNRIVNEQACASLLMAGPGVLATVALGPVLLTLLYSPAFDAAAATLRWLCLGMALRVITWPMGYIIVAKGNQRLFMATELAWAAFNVACTSLGIGRFGLEGAGIGFFASYVLHGVMVYAVVRRLSGFRWAAANLRLGAATLLLCGLVFAAFSVLPLGGAAAFAALAVAGSTLYSLRTLGRLLPADRCPALLRRLLRLGPENVR